MDHSPPQSTEEMPPHSAPIASILALAIAILLAVSAVIFPKGFMHSIQQIDAFFMLLAGKEVIWISSSFLLLAIIISASPLGRIRLGKQDDRPEFSTISWIAMLFAAGMGAGLVFWGAAEPLMHASLPPPSNAMSDAIGPERAAMVISYLHWGLHPWSIYAIGGLAIAYFGFCWEKPLLPSVSFTHRHEMPEVELPTRGFAIIVDLVCALALLLGLAASIAAGTMQIVSGLHWLTGATIVKVPGLGSYGLVLAALVCVYLLSAATKLSQGIRRFSELNMVLAVILCFSIIFMLSFGKIMQNFFTSLTDYLTWLPYLSTVPLEDAANTTEKAWYMKWTANYFFSWFAWVPFVGVFIARISRGRSIRAFLLGTIIVPSLFTFLWFSIIGSAAFYEEATVGGIASAVIETPSSATFHLLSEHPLRELLVPIAVALVFIFLVTSADSASFVLAMLAAEGHPNPAAVSKVLWGIAIGLLSLGTLMAEGGIFAVRTLFSVAGIAVFMVMVAQAAALLVAMFRKEIADNDEEPSPTI